MRIVVNADDFGHSPDTVRATIECLEEAAVTSASLIPGMQATQEAVAYALSRPDLGFGAHLVFVDDREARPLSGAATLPSLTTGDGRFLPTNRIRLLALLGRIPIIEIEREIEAQLSFFLERGLTLTHVDSHRHVHKLPSFRRALAHALPRFGISRVRSVQDVYLRRPLTSATYWLGAAWQRELEREFQTTDHFYMPTSAGDERWAAKLLARIDGLSGETLEVGVHPGLDEPWRARERQETVEFVEQAELRGHVLVGGAELVRPSTTPRM